MGFRKHELVREDVWSRLSLNALSMQAEIDSEARTVALARSGSPPTGVVHRAEIAIAEAIDTRSLARAEAIAEALAAIRLSLATLGKTDLEIEAVIDTVEHRLRATFKTNEDAIRRVILAHEAAQGRYNVFVEKHRLAENLPAYQRSRVLRLGTGAGVWALDAGLSFPLYMSASNFGAIGALATSAVVALGSVTLGAAGGWLCRFLRFTEPSSDGEWRLTRARAVPLLGLVVLGVVAWNGAAALYRDGGYHGLQAAHAMLSEPRGLSFETLGVFGVGCLSAFLSGVKTFKNSPFPGFERRHREATDTEDKRSALKAWLQDAAASVRTSDIEALWERRLAIESEIRTIRQRAADLERKSAKAVELNAEEAEVGRLAIVHYRQKVMALQPHGWTQASFGELPAFRCAHAAPLEALQSEMEAAAAAHTARTLQVIDTIRFARRFVEEVRLQAEEVMRVIAHPPSGSDEADPVARLLQAAREKARRDMLEEKRLAQEEAA